MEVYERKIRFSKFDDGKEVIVKNWARIYKKKSPMVIFTNYNANLAVTITSFLKEIMDYCFKTVKKHGL